MSACAALLLVAITGFADQEVIDRILAVVEGRPITLSDTRAVVALGLEPAPTPPDAVAPTLERLIDRQLMLTEVERYVPAEPRPEAIDARLDTIRKRFPDELAFATTLHQVGLPIDDLRRYLRDTLRIESYTRQRFSFGAEPTEEEIARYYRLHADDFRRDGQVQPFDQVRTLARERLAAERRDVLMRDWLDGLRRRGNIVRLYLAGPPVS
jgi:hypothetical protein